MNGAVVSILIPKACLSLAGFQETGNCLTLSCEVLVYQISQTFVKNYRQCR